MKMQQVSSHFDHKINHWYIIKNLAFRLMLYRFSCNRYRKRKVTSFCKALVYINRKNDSCSTCADLYVTFVCNGKTLFFAQILTRILWMSPLPRWWSKVCTSSYVIESTHDMLAQPTAQPCLWAHADGCIYIKNTRVSFQEDWSRGLNCIFMLIENNKMFWKFKAWIKHDRYAEELVARRLACSCEHTIAQLFQDVKLPEKCWKGNRNMRKLGWARERVPSLGSRCPQFSIAWQCWIFSVFMRYLIVKCDAAPTATKSVK